MNWDRVEGNWKQFSGKVKEKWGKLTDDDLTVINGKQEQLVGRIQERYGVAKEDAHNQIAEWARKATDAWFTPTGVRRIPSTSTRVRPPEVVLEEGRLRRFGRVIEIPAE